MKGPEELTYELPSIDISNKATPRTLIYTYSMIENNTHMCPFFSERRGTLVLREFPLPSQERKKRVVRERY